VSDETRQAVTALERTVSGAAPADLAAILGELERLKTLLWQRLLAAASVPPRDVTDDLRHLTPAQVAELLNLKEAYVHELCRTGRLPSVKHGKYWLIPQAGLRDHLAYRSGDVDHAGQARLQSANPRSDTARGPGGRPRRSPAIG
jgi:excisionase family DNA binding protein